MRVFTFEIRGRGHYVRAARNEGKARERLPEPNKARLLWVEELTVERKVRAVRIGEVVR